MSHPGACLRGMPLLLAQSPFRDDVASREREFVEVTGHMRDQPVANAETSAAVTVIAWFWLITMLTGLLVMGLFAMQRSLTVRRDDGPRSILR